MKKLLHIVATPRGDESRTLKIADAFLETFKAKYPNCNVDILDLSKEKLPSLTLKRVDGKYVLLQGKDLSGDLQEAWEEIITHIERFISADAYLISAPMWNFSIPYTLKHYLDVIMQPKYLFRYTPSGVEGLVKNKKALIVTSRGGDYSGKMNSADFQEPYLRFALGFVGLTDIAFINAEPMDMGQTLQLQKIKEAKVKAKMLALSF